MSPRKIHLLRHAQAYHNVPPCNYNIPDPTLTELGLEQTSTFAREFPHHGNVSVILSSPMTRTLETALLCFPQEVGGECQANSGVQNPEHEGEHEHRHHHKGLKIYAVPELQETSDHPCDTGSSRADLEKVFDGKNIDFSALKEGWQLKTGSMGAEKETILARARTVRELLGEWFGKDDSGKGDVVVVSHGGFLHYLTKPLNAPSTPPSPIQGPSTTTPTPAVTLACSKLPETLQVPTWQPWQNAEYRTFTLRKATADAPWELIETKESLQRRQL
ncbi:unnamed protein product [Zymoseptoria tritici ST99CH_1E4]|uniref:Phosphoglycerate mutase-like protein n=1 Tax=Zymoseptoria tritici ST99CH_1E4 TaxID=1276532 RepID=A0A2H1GAP4_ZYMTR|nr:unnamed protein product [Zymoseptoria tritici ST99CH_1E4]